ncbi:unnamed protein product [Phaeothamnion confervicola]
MTSFGFECDVSKTMSCEAEEALREYSSLSNVDPAWKPLIIAYHVQKYFPNDTLGGKNLLFFDSHRSEILNLMGTILADEKSLLVEQVQRSSKMQYAFSVPDRHKIRALEVRLQALGYKTVIDFETLVPQSKFEEAGANKTELSRELRELLTLGLERVRKGKTRVVYYKIVINTTTAHLCSLDHRMYSQGWLERSYGAAIGVFKADESSEESVLQTRIEE